MNNVCIVNQNITDKFKHLDDEQHQSEHKEHCRKMSIIDSYEEEIKEVLFLSSGCVETSSHSYKEYGLGISPDYINTTNLVDKLQALRANRLQLSYSNLNSSFYGYFPNQSDVDQHGLKFLYERENKEYSEHFLNIVNKYSKEFYNKEYFLRCEGSFMNSYYALVTKDETWKMEYLRHPDTLKTPLEFTCATLLPVFGWFVLLYSLYEAVKIYMKHWRK